jgi:hypothetical protein
MCGFCQGCVVCVGSVKEGSLVPPGGMVGTGLRGRRQLFCVVKGCKVWLHAEPTCGPHCWHGSPQGFSNAPLCVQVPLSGLVGTGLGTGLRRSFYV